MTIGLISQDQDLLRLCRELAGEIPGQHAVLPVASDGNGESDLYVWDYLPNTALPSHIIDQPSKHLVLVHRKDVPGFRQKTNAMETSILLKPVTRATLAAFLGLAASAHAEGNPANGGLRADRDEMLQCLIETNLKLQEYDQDRTNFLARAVHDFRAPLTALSGYCGLLLSGPLGALNEEQKEVLRRMQHSARRLSRMAHAMFQLSVGRHGKKRLEMQPGDIRECIEQALHEIGPFADEKRIAVTVEAAPCGEALYFAAGEIEQVLINVLDNACKFTPRAGSIHVAGYPYFWERRTAGQTLLMGAERRRRAVREPNSYRIDIHDSGASIPERHLDLIFEEYTSYSGGQDRSGGGLGLAICKLIVNQHDGRVWAENTSRGPLFSFVLPLRATPPARCSQFVA